MGLCMSLKAIKDHALKNARLGRRGRNENTRFAGLGIGRELFPNQRRVSSLGESFAKGMAFFFDGQT